MKSSIIVVWLVVGVTYCKAIPLLGNDGPGESSKPAVNITGALAELGIGASHTGQIAATTVAFTSLYAGDYLSDAVQEAGNSTIQAVRELNSGDPLSAVKTLVGGVVDTVNQLGDTVQVATQVLSLNADRALEAATKGIDNTVNVLVGKEPEPY